MAKPLRKKKSGIPTGNAGEYFVMGELLRRGYDAQLADRNTKGYDLLVGKASSASLTKVQVKSVRAAPWYVLLRNYNESPRQITIYVLVGSMDANKPVRYFIAKNRKVKDHIHSPKGWKEHGFMPLKAVQKYEDNWNEFGGPGSLDAESSE